MERKFEENIQIIIHLTISFIKYQVERTEFYSENKTKTEFDLENVPTLI
jgi:hypothetical protein